MAFPDKSLAALKITALWEGVTFAQQASCRVLNREFYQVIGNQPAFRMWTLFDLHIKGVSPTTHSAEQLWGHYLALAQAPTTEKAESRNIKRQLCQGVIWGFFNEIPDARGIALRYADELSRDPRLTPRQSKQGEVLCDLLKWNPSDIDLTMNKAYRKAYKHESSTSGRQALTSLALDGLFRLNRLSQEHSDIEGIQFLREVSEQRTQTIHVRALATLILASEQFELSQQFQPAFSIRKIPTVSPLQHSPISDRDACTLLIDRCLKEPVRPNIKRLAELLLASFVVHKRFPRMRPDLEIAEYASHCFNHPLQSREVGLISSEGMAEDILHQLINSSPERCLKNTVQPANEINISVLKTTRIWDYLTETDKATCSSLNSEMRNFFIARMNLLLDRHVNGMPPTSQSLQSLWNYFVERAQGLTTSLSEALTIRAYLTQGVVWGFFQEIPTSIATARKLLSSTQNVEGLKNRARNLTLNYWASRSPEALAELNDFFATPERQQSFPNIWLLSHLYQLENEDDISEGQTNNIQVMAEQSPIPHRRALAKLILARDQFYLKPNVDNDHKICTSLLALSRDPTLRPNVRRIANVILALYETFERFSPVHSDFEIGILARRCLDQPIQFLEAGLSEVSLLAIYILTRLRVTERAFMISSQEMFNYAIEEDETTYFKHMASIACLQANKDLFHNKQRMELDSAIANLQNLFANASDPGFKFEISWKLAQIVQGSDIYLRYFWENSHKDSPKRIPIALSWLLNATRSPGTDYSSPPMQELILFTQGIVTNPLATFAQIAEAKTTLASLGSHFPREQAIAYCCEVANDQRVSFHQREYAALLLKKHLF